MSAVAIIGLGLIGGSFALALRAAHPELEVIGFDRDAASTARALQRGVITAIGHDPADLRLADTILLAVPVRQIEATLRWLQPALADHAVLSDVGSTKQDVIGSAAAVLGSELSRFVPAHPIAGRETSGIDAADETLFKGKNVVITPLPQNPAAACEQIAALWRSCGANIVEMTPQVHDAVFAAVSHLPHLLAFALVDEIASRANARSLFAFAASGFRDFTRIAGSNPEMWRDVALNNRAALLAEVDRYTERLHTLRTALAAADGDALEAMMVRARTARAQWLAGELDNFRDDSAT